MSYLCVIFSFSSFSKTVTESLHTQNLTPLVCFCNELILYYKSYQESQKVVGFIGVALKILYVLTISDEISKLNHCFSKPPHGHQ